eukprot:693380-Hanusia_phi.AAC.5
MSGISQAGSEWHILSTCTIGLFTIEVLCFIATFFISASLKRFECKLLYSDCSNLIVDQLTILLDRWRSVDLYFTLAIGHHRAQSRKWNSECHPRPMLFGVCTTYLCLASKMYCRYQVEYRIYTANAPIQLACCTLCNIAVHFATWSSWF